MAEPTVVGWREWVDLPDWGITGVRAKIDTGARTSAIDVAELEFLDDDHVRFEVVSRLEPTRETQWITAECVRISRVKPSSGEVQERAVCMTHVRIGAHEFNIELSLVCRRHMTCRMLIGRTALAGRFLVDASRKNVLSRRRGRKPRKEDA